MSQNCTPEFKRKIVRIHEEEGRTYKSGGIHCKGNRLGAYRLIDDYQTELGVRWLLRRLAICPSMSVYLKREGHSYSAATIHKYMNVEMGPFHRPSPKAGGKAREAPQSV